MTKDELIKTLNECAIQCDGDEEAAHLTADAALIEYINDPIVKMAFENIRKWYA